MGPDRNPKHTSHFTAKHGSRWGESMCLLR
jgi:hypothetical protein